MGNIRIIEVDTIWYNIALVMVGLLLIVNIIYFIKVWQCRKNSNRKTTKNRKIIIYNKSYKKRRTKITTWQKMFTIIIAIAFMLLTINKFQYRMFTKFGWETDNINTSNLLDFKIIRREKTEPSEEKELIHLNWYSLAFDSVTNKIDRDGLEIYSTNVENIFSVYPEKEDIITGDANDPTFKDAREKFMYYVGSDSSNISPQDLWVGYKDGEIVKEKNRTSEITFQMGVLAESAHANQFKISDGGEDTIQYLEGAITQFEDFLKYSNHYIGEGNYAYKEDVSFRIGKMLRREAISGTQNDIIKAHCAVYAYECFRYALENTEVSNPQYLTRLYYSGVSCLGVLEYIVDKSLKDELCREELYKWDQLEALRSENFYKYYNVEGKAPQEILEVKDYLADRIE